MSALSDFFRARLRRQTDHSRPYQSKIISRHRMWQTFGRQTSRDQMGRGVDRHSTQSPSIEAVEIDLNLDKAASLSSAPAAAALYDSLPLAGPKSTRVLKILPPELQDGDNIKCQLEMISLDDDPLPKYCAVSYVWGGPSQTRCIMVNNEPFVVRKNLWAFLECMRKQGFQDLLWIDAVCINQTCIPERNHQVSVMGDIYRNATRVIAWLGLESEIVPFDCEELKDFHGKTYRLGDYRYLQAPFLDSIGFMLQKIEEFSTQPRYPIAMSSRKFEILFQLFARLEQLFKAEYWTRMWITQEYVLAREVLLLTDRSEMNGKSLANVCKVFNKAPWRSSELRVDIDDASNFVIHDSFHGPLFDAVSRLESYPAMNIIQQREKAHSRITYKALEALILEFKDLQCFDSRDHVYALLSLVDPADLIYYATFPDYSRSKVLLYTELTYGSIRRKVMSSPFSTTLFATVLGIEKGVEIEIFHRVWQRVRFENSVGRHSSPGEVADDIGDLGL